MDRIQKFLQRLSKKELRRVLMIISKLERNDLAGLDVKKLMGYKDIFRVRSGDIRILFLRSKNSFRLISIERKSDTTYKL